MARAKQRGRRFFAALRLAKNFASSKGGLGAVPTAFIASGETYATAAAIEAAASSGALSVSIGASSDTNNDKATNADDPVRPGTTFSLCFSDDVAGTDAELLATPSGSRPRSIRLARRTISAGLHPSRLRRSSQLLRTQPGLG